LRETIPSFFKVILRLFYYKQERVRFFREFAIRKHQNINIRKLDRQSKKIILFLIEGADFSTGKDRISGGIISIVSICEASSGMISVHGAQTILCTLPQERLLEKHTQFANNTPVFRFSQLSYFKAREEVLVHVPEYLVVHFIKLLTEHKLKWLKGAPKLHVNILNQSIKLMPEPVMISKLNNYCNKLTITTAHQQYCNAHFRDFYQVPIHKFSVWISPEKYSFKNYSQKDNLIVVSPDPHSNREEILNLLSSIRGLTIHVINNLTYEQYKHVISKAKWALTFGEGLDGYFIEPIFSGAISFAVFNDDFFTSDFSELDTVYSSFDAMKEKIVDDILRLDTENSYTEYQVEQFNLCAKYYSLTEYSNNIREFYQGSYTYA
jgi:hypothetical protein